MLDPKLEPEPSKAEGSHVHGHGHGQDRPHAHARGHAQDRAHGRAEQAPPKASTPPSSHGSAGGDMISGLNLHFSEHGGGGAGPETPTLATSQAWENLTEAALRRVRALTYPSACLPAAASTPIAVDVA